MNLTKEIRALKASKVKEAYEKLKDSEDFLSRKSTIRRYMICIEADMTISVVSELLNDLNIKV